MSDSFSLKLAMFPVKEKKNERGPDHTGSIEIPKGEISALIQHLQSAESEEDYQGNPIVKLAVSTWINEMKDGRKYLKGSVQAPYKPDSKPVAAEPVPSDCPF